MLSFIQRGPIEQSPSRWWNSQQVWMLNYLRTAITDTPNDCGQQYLSLNIRQDNKNCLKPCLVTLWSCYNIHCFPKYWGAGKIDHHTGHTLLFLVPYKKILGFSVVLEETLVSVKSKWFLCLGAYTFEGRISWKSANLV